MATSIISGIKTPKIASVFDGHLMKVTNSCCQSKRHVPTDWCN